MRLKGRPVTALNQTTISQYNLMAELDPIRGRRVILLALAAVAMSFLDLYQTAMVAGDLSFRELNPIGAWFLAVESVTALSLYKLGTLAISVAALYKIRHHPLGELASWLIFTLLIALTMHWYLYHEIMAFHTGM